MQVLSKGAVCPQPITSMAGLVSLSSLTFFVFSLTHFFLTTEKCFFLNLMCNKYNNVYINFSNRDTFRARLYQCKFAIQNVIIEVRKYVLNIKLSTDYGQI